MEMIIGAEDAAFLVGTGGKTKDKVARVAGARLDLPDADDGKHRLEIFGKDENRRKAKQYVQWVLRQRVGPITVDTSGPRRDDLSIVSVPLDCVAYVMGKNGIRASKHRGGIRHAHVLRQADERCRGGRREAHDPGKPKEQARRGTEGHERGGAQAEGVFRG